MRACAPTMTTPDSRRPDAGPGPETGRTEKRWTLPGDVHVVSVFGMRDEVLRTVERGFPHLSVLARGHDVTLTGPADDVAVAARLLDELVDVARRGTPLTAEGVERAITMLRAARTGATPGSVGAGGSAAATGAPGAGSARGIGGDDATALLTADILSARGRTIRPKTLGQKAYVDAIDEHTIVFGIGPAGTGKTYLAMAKAVVALQSRQVSRIILTRPAVEAGESLGFLPGTLNDKIDPYLRPLYDALHDMVDPDSIPRLMAAGTIEVAPLAYMRGRTLNDAFIILDEAQNTSPEQMKMFLTRLGFGSTVVVTGDITQVDLPGGQRSGLRVVQEILTDIEDIAFCRLTSADVVRHRLVGEIIDAYERHDALAASLPSAKPGRRRPPQKENR